ncbi:cytochrome b/b6 domain-containing protein [Agromyces sp. NPDC058484]|uniref:cytochrome b/b6 domain-containing protein n=1 Tax=Agromyces sp. NPDC058484 TaxID=3346524 RepID=UPI0036478AF1
MPSETLAGQTETAPGAEPVAEEPALAAPAAPAATVTTAGGSRPIRRGLPRVAGGEPWPPAGLVTLPAAATATGSDCALRRGLPRVKGGEPWPPAGFPPATAAPEPATPAALEPVVPVAAPAPAARARPARTGLPRPAAATAPAVQSAAPEPVTQPSAAASVATATATASAAQPTRAPLARTTAPARPAAPARPTVPTRPEARPAAAPAREPVRFDAVNRSGLLGAVIVGGFGLLLAATVAVVGASWFMSSPAGQDFLAAFPGEYHLPEGGAEPGFPAWVQWQHFFNVFLIVLIIRSGLQVRTEKKPSAYWTPRWSRGGQGKISLALWFHQSLDILWLINGVVFVVLLFVTGHWVRIVPTSWEVFPNAISAGLQYLSLDWPTENGWVNYNSLQQLMYFITVFIAAPLAAITGVRMSGLWPKNAKTLNRIYPVEWARAIHFPVMLYFVAFIIVHVALVFATGALRNLNHMYGGSDVVNWAGFWTFFASLVIIVGGWIAARPFVLAQIAKLSGKVTAR